MTMGLADCIAIGEEWFKSFRLPDGGRKRKGRRCNWASPYFGTVGETSKNSHMRNLHDIKWKRPASGRSISGTASVRL